MKKTLRFSIVLAGACLWASTGFGQVTWNAQYMGRSEYRHGFGTPAKTDADAAFFIGQRARFGMNYAGDKWRIGISAQDIRTWGQTANGTVDASGLLSLHEGFAEIMPSKKIAVKVGRQEIAYDEDRIFGSLDWALQARRHDAALFKYEDSTFKAHVGAAYNQDKEQSAGTIYNVAGNYKTFQYAYLSKQIKDLNLSLLLLNNGLQWTKLDTNNVVTESGVRFSQTAGLRAAYTKGKLGANGTFYYQMGKDVADKDLSAYEASVEVSYKPIDPLKVTLGYELLSGTSQTDTANKGNNSFTPFYGTNHRFNGYMDLFYVNNFTNTVGLQDAYLKVMYSRPKWFVALDGHMFMSAADIRDVSNLTEIAAMPSSLGTEIDLSFSYNLRENVALQAGYSHFLATESFEAVRGGDKDETQNWAYVMLLVRPGKVKWPKSGLKL